MHTGLAALALTTAFAASAAAQPASSPQELSSRMQVESGDTIFVLDNLSREVRGVLGTLSDTKLTVMVDGSLREIPFSDVRRITRLGGDSLWNGLLIGAGVGALSGGALQGPAVALQGALIYGAIGALVDKARRGKVEVYRAPAGIAIRVLPVFSPGHQGVRASLSF